MPKRNNRRLLGQRRKQREARAKAYEKALARWLASYRNFLQRQTLDTFKGRVLKVNGEEYYRDKLAELINLFGMREAADAANNAMGSVIVPRRLIEESEKNEGYGPVSQVKWFWREYQDGVFVRANDIMQDTKLRINRKVNNMVQLALQEEPNPTVAEFARRIRGEVFEDEYTFSPNRAALIARTELTQAQNAGTFEGYKASGVERVEWLAFNDGKSGDRHHERLNGKIITVGEKFHNKATGVKLRYPGDPSAPISETANCRCTLAPVI